MYKNLRADSFHTAQAHCLRQQAKATFYSRNMNNPNKYLAHNYRNNTAAKAIYSCGGHGGRCPGCKGWKVDKEKKYAFKRLMDDLWYL